MWTKFNQPKTGMSLLKRSLAPWALAPLLPLILWQGKQVRRNTVRLPEAMGEPHFPATDDNALSLLHLGESTVAGVGVRDIRDGLTANIINSLQRDGVAARAWAQGLNGATVAEINTLAPTIIHPDILLVTLGVNDTVRMTSDKDWRQQLELCVARFAGPNTHVCFTQVPDMARFPALPAPLNRFLGLKSQQLHQALKSLCHQRSWSLFEVDLPIAGAWMAIDGYHPNAQGYKHWGQAIARQLQHIT